MYPILRKGPIKRLCLALLKSAFVIQLAWLKCGLYFEALFLNIVHFVYIVLCNV